MKQFFQSKFFYIAVVAALLNLSEFKDARAGFSFQSTGKMITPLGTELLRSGAAQDGELIGLDSTCALEMVKAGDVTTEFDKLIESVQKKATKLRQVKSALLEEMFV